MRHRKHHAYLSRTAGERVALLRALACQLVTYGRIRTTEVKAKALRPYVERLVTLGKKEIAAPLNEKGKKTAHYRRLAFSRMQKKGPVTKLFEEVAPRFTTRPGGFTRIVRDTQRHGDGSWMAYIEWVDHEVAPPADNTTATDATAQAAS